MLSLRTPLLSVVRALLTGLFMVMGPLCAPRPAAAASTEYLLGLGALGSYNSQVIAAAPTPTMPTIEGGGFSVSATPWLQLKVESGRITETLRLQGLLGVDVLVSGPQASPAYQGTFQSTTLMELTARLRINLLLSATVGQINSFTQLQDPSTQELGGLSLRALDFFSVNLGENLIWEPTARWRITQPLTFRSYIPFGNISVADGVTSSATAALQSYSLEAGLGFDYLWARATLGSELRIGYFLPEQGATTAPDENATIVTAQLVGRGTWQIAPRWKSEANAGVFAATSTYPAFAQEVLITPIGMVLIGYTFPRVEAGISLSYAHSAAAEVLLGQLTLSDAVTLRAFVPLPRQVILSAAAGYRYARYTGNGGVDFVANSPSYQLVEADASVTWNARPGLQLYARGQFMLQCAVPDAGSCPNQQPPSSAVVVTDFTRFVATVGVAYIYPQR